LESETICIYTPSAAGGMARYARELMLALADHPRGHYRFELVSGQDLLEEFRPAAYAVNPILRPLQRRSEFGTRASWIASRLAHYPRRDWQFLQWLKGRPDVTTVHFQEWTPWLAAPLIRRIQRMGKKVFSTVHNVIPHKYPALVPKAVVDRWFRTACRLCDGLFVHTDRLSDELVQVLGEPHPPIHVVPHGVWTVPDAAGAATLADRLAMKQLLLFGVIRRNKGIDLLLRAAKALPGYGITLAGDPQDVEYFHGEVLPEVRRLQAAGLKIDLIDRFLTEDEIGPLFRRHSAIVLPYTQEFVAQSGVVFMALAYNLPVVASEAGGLRDLFEQFRIGTTFAQATEASLVAAVRALHEAQDPRQLEEQIRAAKRRFSWHEAAGATIAGYMAAQESGMQSDDCSVQTSTAH
jgi:glycosyltransferase involved in cell wall biosynthesis